MTESFAPDMEGVPMDRRLTLEVSHLTYSPSSQLHQSMMKYVSEALPTSLYAKIKSLNQSDKSAEIEDVSFKACPSQFTAILSGNMAERRTIVELIAGRRAYGMFNGEVIVSGGGSKASAMTRQQAIAFVPRAARKLYTPGLTYLEMITYAAKLRLNLQGSAAENEDFINRRVAHVLSMMGLTWCKDRLITERPNTRGALGGELRKLSIAVEIIQLAPIIVLDDPTRNLDAIVSTQLVDTLISLTERGFNIVCSLPKPRVQEFSRVHKLVLVAQGRSIYAAETKHIIDYFCSGSLGYMRSDETDLVDFLMDIADGIERPKGQRKAPTPEVLHSQFESSKYNEVDVTDITSGMLVLPRDHVPNYGLFHWDDWRTVAYRTYVVTERAFFVKFKEYEVLKKSFLSSVVCSLFLGYFMLNQGNFGDYCLSLLGFPYDKVTNISANLFLMIAVLFVMQVLNVHIICQKLQTFRYERSAKCCPSVGFCLAIILSEVPFSVFFGLVFSNISYFMIDLKSSVEDYFFYMGVHVFVSIIGVTTTVLFAATFRREIVVRDLYLCVTFMMVMTSGFVFQLPSMEDAIVDIAEINPLRWAYEGLMVWEFEDYPDGDTHLSNYGFENFQKHEAFAILLNFIIFDIIMLLIVLIRGLFTLHRKRGTEATPNRESVDIQNSLRATDALKPQIFLRESSITSKVAITSQPSATGLEGEYDTKGPTVQLRDLTYRVPDAKSPEGFTNTLRGICGRFDWGKLSVIMGATGSGKSSLLHILGGHKVLAGAKLSGSVLYDDKPMNEALLPWQRCAFVESLDEHFRDLTVHDVITYAMQLRSTNKATLNAVALNVNRTLELLQLNEVAMTKTKDLSRGCLRRLSIAEEIVHGPSLILVDEPITDLDHKDIPIIMTRTFRELVNQDRTVICTMHQPSAKSFELIDTLMLLSKGRMIYMGPAEKAAPFFIESPSLNFDFAEYTNPADFLNDISSCLFKNKDGLVVDAPTLEHLFKDSVAYDAFTPSGSSLSAATSLSSLSSKFPSKMSGTDYSSENPLRVSLTGPDEDSPMTRMSRGRLDEPLSPTKSNAASVDIDYDVSANPRKFQALIAMYCVWMFTSTVQFYNELRHLDCSMTYNHCKVLMVRSFYILFNRHKMIVATLVMHIFLAVNFGYILGPSGDESTAVTSLFGIGTMLLILTNVQLVFFMFKNNEVFLKEQSRGLYSTFLHWVIDDIPLFIMRTIHALLYGVILHEMIELKGGDTEGFFYLALWLSVIAGTMLVETLVLLLPDIRSAYGVIPGVSFLLFFFSGIMLKPSTLPTWLQPWLPSVSIIRWTMQAEFINEFEGDDDVFPVINGSYSTYDAFLGLFGWGGKTKWMCLEIVVLNLLIYRLVTLIAMLRMTVTQRGKRIYRKHFVEERMY